MQKGEESSYKYLIAVTKIQNVGDRIYVTIHKTDAADLATGKLKPYKLEDHVNDWVKAQLDRLKLKNQKDYYTESAIPDYLKEALKGRAKTENKTNFGKPDF